MTTPVHVVSGFLGAGKTTLLLRELARRAPTERGAVIVNDFGEARFDAARFDGAVAVAEVAGGCVCCTAPDALVPLVSALLETERPDRIYIETTGLARPADVVDTLRRSGLPLALRPVLVVLDARRLEREIPPLMHEQLDAADLVVLSHADALTPAHRAAFSALMADHFPPLLAVFEAQSGEVAPGLFDRQRDEDPVGHAHHHDHDHASTEGYSVASRTWSAERVFDAAALKAVLAGCAAERVKGLFRTDMGWLRLERAGGEVHVDGSPLRACSAVDVIVAGEGAEAILAQLEGCVATAQAAFAGIRVEDAEGRADLWTRERLLALPGQVADVSALVPGRNGAGVMLRELAARAGRGSRFVVVASDGLSTAPAPIAEIGDAVLVHSLAEGPLPTEQGGPFRLLVPAGASACANVKGVARIVLER